ncbi:response regulator transcription factor [Clostridium pasteurianum]|uniref:Stage 0 sporulation protein A homolog n=1 Tax=Clostridium pasteurianum BC1 TaxID=86416 RepID=R4KDU5_CLOPA|nr:response regulator transcription factor [Clostridium pasteurianum]AGK98709.1 response regulator with CheY-like receiver domain and winged-helix DNA-binding domain [Clostridium pasteurianum BC1]
MYRLLLVEDDEPLAIGIEFTLKDAGYEVLRTSTVERTKKIFQKEKFQLVILDVNLPDGSGYDLCKYIRNESNIPIMFLTALDDEVNIVLGLEIGGDDYMAKPFGVKEFLSRIKVLIRRNYKNTLNGNILKSGDIIMDTSTAYITKNGKEVTLTAQEYKLLLIFMNKPMVIIKRREILRELIEGEEAFFDENTLSVYIKRIREKIEDNIKAPEYIVTQRGMGYLWNKSVVKE